MTKWRHTLESVLEGFLNILRNVLLCCDFSCPSPVSPADEDVGGSKQRDLALFPCFLLTPHFGSSGTRWEELPSRHCPGQITSLFPHLQKVDK